MERVRIASVDDGSITDDSGRVLQRIGNALMQENDDVLTDGVVAYGHTGRGWNPTIPLVTPVAAIPLWYQDGKMKYYDINSRQIVDLGRAHGFTDGASFLNRNDKMAWVEVDGSIYKRGYDCDIYEDGNLCFIANGTYRYLRKYREDTERFNTPTYVNGVLKAKGSSGRIITGLTFTAPEKGNIYCELKDKSKAKVYITPETALEGIREIAEFAKNHLGEECDDWTVLREVAEIQEARIKDNGKYCYKLEAETVLIGQVSGIFIAYIMNATITESSSSDQWIEYPLLDVPITVTVDTYTKAQMLSPEENKLDRILPARIEIHLKRYFENGKVRKEEKEITFEIDNSLTEYGMEKYSAPPEYPLTLPPHGEVPSPTPPERQCYNSYLTYNYQHRDKHSYFDGHNITVELSSDYIYLPNNFYIYRHTKPVPKPIKESFGDDEHKKYIINDDFIFQDEAIYDNGTKIFSLPGVKYEDFGESFSLYKVSDDRYVMLLDGSLFEIERSHGDFIQKEVDTSGEIVNKRISLIDDINKYIDFADKG